MVVLDKVFELAGEVGQLMADTLSTRGLTPARAEALLVLDQYGVPIVQRQFGQALRCTPRHVTALVDALESRGLVRRDPHPTDRRATLVSLTESGAAAAAQMAGERRAAAHTVLGGLPAADLAGFLTVADHVLCHLAGPHSAPAPSVDPAPGP